MIHTMLEFIYIPMGEFPRFQLDHTRMKWFVGQFHKLVHMFSEILDSISPIR